MAAQVDLGPVRRALSGARLTTGDLQAGCRAAADALGVAGVAVTVTLPHTLRVVLAASNEVALLLEEAQLTVAEGPCTVASVTGSPVSSPDLADPGETRWPMLAHYLTDVPVRAVAALPLIPVGALRAGRALGSMDCFSTYPHGLDHLDTTALTGTAGLLADAVLRTVPVGPVPDGAAWAHPSWAELHQATGMVMAELGLSALDALDTLRARAFTTGRLLREVADAVTAGREPGTDPDPPHRPTL